MNSRFITVEVHYAIGDVVYLKSDPDGYPRLVTSYSLRSDTGKDFSVSYELTLGTADSWHKAMEITREKAPEFLNGTDQVEAQ